MEFDLRLTETDWLNFNKYVQMKRKGLLGGFWVNMVLWFLITMTLVLLFHLVDSLHWPTVSLLGVIFTILIGYFILNAARLQKALMPSKDGTFLGTHHLKFDEKGIHSTGRGYSAFHEWSTVKSIECGRQMILIFIDTAQAFVFPESQLKDAEAFLHEIHQFKA